MLFYLLPFFFRLQGAHGINSYKEDFRFCADRVQTVKGHLRYEFQKDAITIVNSVDGLNISAPFSPGPQQSWVFPERSGRYRFCVYWFQDTHLLSLNYGITKNYTLSNQADYSLPSPIVTWKENDVGNRLLYSVSYAYNNGSCNISLPSLAGYRFSLSELHPGSGGPESGKRDQKQKLVQISDVEKEMRETEEKLKSLETCPGCGKNVASEDPFLYLQRLESKLGEVEFQGDHKTFEGTAVHANVQKVPLHIPENLPIGVTLKEDKVVRKFQVTLPKKVFEKSRDGSKSGKMKVVVLAATSETLFQDNDSNSLLGGNVIGISVGNTPVHGLPKEERISITFWHHLLQRNLTPACVFWDMGSKAGHPGKWNTSGCEAVQEEYQTTCLCDHLTFFAVLMVSSPDIDHIHYEYLTIVTYVGCIISALASFFTIFFFLCSKKKQRDHIVYVHMNLLWAIFLLDMSFLIAVPLAPTGGDMACKAGGMFLHFGVLACLTWMAIEGYSLYRLVIEVFNSYVKHFLFKLCLVGWGLPIFMVCLIFVINHSHYGPSSFKVYESPDKYTNATICWITKKEINNFLNLGYLSLVLFFNSIMLATMVYEILKLRHREHHWEYAVMLLGLSCVLGIPWGLVFFAFASGTFKLVAVYLFTIINSLQGFLIFLWYLAKVLQSRRSSSMQCTTSNSLKLQSSSTSI
ncbi:adhesion G-protein coupled receptor G1 isoform X1 [Python bivittatus]|uniref:Adhesion G-protein coupled receptor G1 n=1 Tax=Python bivittatus TaxID=176946 RepID=A0A9F2QZA8_PYTBI|nr:adhesion G-protein coupled receptor G1 isoform X1 [Python bivittatus]